MNYSRWSSVIACLSTSQRQELRSYLLDKYPKAALTIDGNVRPLVWAMVCLSKDVQRAALSDILRVLKG